ncbi:hypothetical protein HF909_10700 [Ralstonia pseudosolanacearum]|uniref:Uncharacterized protein n=1 Tax=Ralstonia solanacearum TaxID=305 RepID=A0AA92QBD8_RALSL|nr:hypothetical protein [Ralstonia pseudosolanacearum]QOK96853.1 hypothetical protein HF909_10700 [Ralstonia pseudosolanacearum]
MQREKVSITLPATLRAQLETQRREMSARTGCELTLSQTAQALLQRAMESQPAAHPR